MANPNGALAQPEVNPDLEVAHRAFNRSDFFVAIDKYRKVLGSDLKNADRVSAELGLGTALIVTKRQKDGVAAFERALRLDPLAQLDTRRTRPDIVKQFESVRQRLKGVLDIRSNRSPSTLKLDNRAIGNLPQRLTVSIGNHDIQILSNNNLQVTKTLLVRADAVTNFVWNPIVTADGSSAHQLADSSSRPFYKTWWFWTAVSVVVAAGVTTGVILATADGNRSCAELGCFDLR